MLKLLDVTRSSLLRYSVGLIGVAAALLFIYPNLAGNLFATGTDFDMFMSHGYCYFWEPSLVVLHVLSDLIIGFSYVAISLTLAYLVHRARRDIPFHWVFLAFGLFIIACGATHFMEVITVWHATYWLSGYIKLITAVASIATAVILPAVVPKALGAAEVVKVSNARKLELERINEELVKEIAKRESVERTLTESTRRERAIVEKSLNVICSTNTEGNFVGINPACYEVLGYQPEELIGRPFADFITPEDVAKSNEVAANVMSGEEIRNFENRYRHKNGSLVNLEWSAFWLESEQLLFAMAYDITRRKETEDKLRNFADRLERSNTELQDFASIASHDLQEPLRKVQAFGDRLKTKNGDALSDEGRDYLERMLNAAGRMQTLINDLLTFSRVAIKAQPFVPVNLRVVTDEVLSDLETLIEKTNGVIEVGELGTIDADPTQMRQLLQNLIGNALKFHRPDASPIVKISGRTISVPDKIVGVEIFRLIVEDNGIGFEDKNADKIFKVFQRLHGRGEYEGTGIGLAVCRKIAERHGGRIKTESKPGEGARFIIDLPVKQKENIKLL